jgi:hypothetical protein
LSNGVILAGRFDEALKAASRAGELTRNTAGYHPGVALLTMTRKRSEISQQRQSGSPTRRGFRFCWRSY